jgi:hypothetical protein
MCRQRRGADFLGAFQNDQRGDIENLRNQTESCSTQVEMEITFHRTVNTRKCQIPTQKHSEGAGACYTD